MNPNNPLEQPTDQPAVAPVPPVYAPVQPPETPPFQPQPMAAPPMQQPVAPPPYSQQQSTAGSGMSLAGFIVSLVSILINAFTFGIPAVVGLILSIIGRVQTKRAGKASGLALAGIIISSIVGLLTIAFFVFIMTLGFQSLAEGNARCQELGPGTHRTTILGAPGTLICDANGQYSDFES